MRATNCWLWRTAETDRLPEDYRWTLHGASRTVTDSDDIRNKAGAVPTDDENSSGMPKIDPEILARAEEAVAALGVDFVSETRRGLSENLATVTQTGFESNSGAIGTVFEFAHDMRGQGSTFGYPLLSAIGTSLCAFVEAREHHLVTGDAAVFSAHFDAAAAILTNEMTGEGDPVAQALLKDLGDLVQNRLSTQT